MSRSLWYLGVAICVLGWGALAFLLLVAVGLEGMTDVVSPLKDPSFRALCGRWLLFDVLMTTALACSARRIG